LRSTIAKLKTPKGRGYPAAHNPAMLLFAALQHACGSVLSMSGKMELEGVLVLRGPADKVADKIGTQHTSSWRDVSSHDREHQAVTQM